MSSAVLKDPKSPSRCFCCLKLTLNDHKTILLGCVYLPTDYGNDSSKQELIYTWGELAGYILVNPTDELMIVGDFNVDFNRSQNQFTMTLSQFMYDRGLVAADQFFAHKIPYTYESDLCVGRTWIDHILISRTGGCHAIYKKISQNLKNGKLTSLYNNIPFIVQCFHDQQHSQWHKKASRKYQTRNSQNGPNVSLLSSFFF